MALKWVIFEDEFGSGMCLEKDLHLHIKNSPNIRVIGEFNTNSANEARRKYDEFFGFDVRDDLVPDIVYDDEGNVVV